MTDKYENSSSPAAEIVVDILEFLTAQGERSLTDISDALGVPKSTCYRILGVLERRKWVQREEKTKRYSLGAAVLSPAAAYLSGADLVQRFQSVARRIVAACNETVYLAILDGVDVLYLGKEEANQPVRMVSRVGDRLPAHLTALGKVLLAGLPEEVLDARFAGQTLSGRTPSSITTLPALKQELARVRAMNCAYDRQECWLDVRCVGAPVFNAHGEVIAAMSIAVPVSRASDARMEELAALIQAGAQAVSKDIGCSAWGYAHCVATQLSP